MTDTDLAFRFRHGWIRLNPDGTDFKPSDPVKTEKALKTLARLRAKDKLHLAPEIAKAEERWNRDKQIQAALDASATKTAVAKQVGKGSKTKAHKVRARLKALLEAQNPAVEDYRAIWNEQDKAQAARRARRGASLSNDGSGDVDLAMKAFRPTVRPGGVRPSVSGGRPVAPKPPKPRPAGVSKTLVRGFKKSAGVNSINSAKAHAVLQRRASQPGHFRAKAILAAQAGNTAKVKRLLAKRAVAKAARHTGVTLAKPKKPATRPYRPYRPPTVRK